MLKPIEEEVLNYFVKNKSNLNEMLEITKALGQENICHISLLYEKGGFSEELGKRMRLKWGNKIDYLFEFDYSEGKTMGYEEETRIFDRLKQKDEWGNPVYFSWEEIERKSKLRSSMETLKRRVKSGKGILTASSKAY